MGWNSTYCSSGQVLYIFLNLYVHIGVLGIKVKIMLPWDPSGKIGPKKPLPDHVSIVEPKDEVLPTTPVSEQKGAGAKAEAPVMPPGTPVPTA